MYQEWHTEIRDGLIQRIVTRIVDIVALDRVWPDKNPFEAKLIDDALGLLDGELGILDGNDTDAQQTLAVYGAVIVKPVIISAAQRGCVSVFFNRRQIQSRRGKQQPAFDMIAVHRLETVF